MLLWTVAALADLRFCFTLTFWVSSAICFKVCSNWGCRWFRPSMALDKVGYTESIRVMVANSNATSDFDCIRSQKEVSNCFFVPTVFPHLSTKMFILEGAYDSWQLHHILGFPCATYEQTLEHCSKAQNASLENYGDAMRASIRSALESTRHHKQTSGTFVSQCIIHVQMHSTKIMMYGMGCFE